MQTPRVARIIVLVLLAAPSAWLSEAPGAQIVSKDSRNDPLDGENTADQVTLTDIRNEPDSPDDWRGQQGAVQEDSQRVLHEEDYEDLQDTLLQYLHHFNDSSSMQDTLRQYLRDLEGTLLLNQTTHEFVEEGSGEQLAGDGSTRRRVEEALKRARESLERTLDEAMRQAQADAAHETHDGDPQQEHGVDGVGQNSAKASNESTTPGVDVGVPHTTDNGVSSSSTASPSQSGANTLNEHAAKEHVLEAPRADVPSAGATEFIAPPMRDDDGDELVVPLLAVTTSAPAQDVPPESEDGDKGGMTQFFESSPLVGTPRPRSRADEPWCQSEQPQPLRLPALPNGVPDSKEEQCARESRLLDLHLRNHTLWAVQMQDAGACGVNGLLEGNVYHLGDFDECLEVAGPVRTQYCIAEISILTPSRTPDHHHHPDTRPNPMQSVWNTIRHEGEGWRLPLDRVHVALCAPASCPAGELQGAVQRALAAHANCSRLPVAFSAAVPDSLCTSAADLHSPYTKGELAYLILVLMILVCTISGTFLDVYSTKKKGCPHCFLLMFSLRRNWHLLTKADPKPAGLDLNPISGARTLNMLLLVIAHRGFNLLRGPVHNYSHFEAVPRRVLHTGATHAQLFVDTCFVMSGMLVSLLELTRAHAIGMKHSEPEQRPSLMAAVIHRYLRLTPSYAMVVFFYASVFGRMGSGPLWQEVIGHESEACAKYWWTNLFYVNNYINTDKLCMFQSWYLPCDLHMFVLGTALTLLLARYRRTGLTLVAVFTAASVAVPMVVTITGKKAALLEMLPPLFRAPDQSDHFRTMYAPTHVRAAPYMIGLLVGYLFHLHGVRVKQHFSPTVTWLLFLGGVALTTGALLSSVVFYDPDMVYNRWVAGVYASLCPVVWSVGVGLVFTSLVLGSKTLISMVLSWRPLVVLSKLTYNVYLTHWAIQMASVAKMRTPVHLDVWNLFAMAFGDIVSSFIAAVLLFMLVEAPFRTLARRITAPPPESPGRERFPDEEKPSGLERGITGTIARRS